MHLQEIVTQWLPRVKSSEKHGLKLILQVINHKGQKKFKGAPKKKDILKQDLSDMEEAQKELNRSQNRTSYSFFYGEY